MRTTKKDSRRRVTRAIGSKLCCAVYHYHDKNELECDLVISLRDGRWAGVEVKLGRNEEEDAVKNLLKLASKVDEQKMSKPSFLMILTAGQFAYRREDGVYVVPVGCLKP